MGTRLLKTETRIILQILFNRILSKEKERTFKFIAEEMTRAGRTECHLIFVT